MKLLFDQNLSRRLVDLVSDLWPGSVHVREVGLAEADDNRVWSYAAKNDLTIVSKDSDFHQYSFLYGAPPKVIWLRCGNCSTGELARLLREHHASISEFESDGDTAFLVIPGSSEEGLSAGRAVET